MYNLNGLCYYFVNDFFMYFSEGNILIDLNFLFVKIKMVVFLILKIKGIFIIFGEVLERNVIFCIDILGSMYKGLDVVKEYLVEILLKQVNKFNCMFNIIEFNFEVIQWVDKMVKCILEIVVVVVIWVKKFSVKIGINI